MPNTQVEELMRLATKMMRASWATGDAAAWQPAYQELESALRAALEAHARALAPQWQPIETAPKDKWFLAHGPDRTGAKYMVMCREGGLGQCFISADDGHGPYMNPTHWMPLPPAPKG